MISMKFEDFFNVVIVYLYFLYIVSPFTCRVCKDVDIL
jgi:hypothetical protein